MNELYIYFLCVCVCVSNMYQNIIVCHGITFNDYSNYLLFCIHSAQFSKYDEVPSHVFIAASVDLLLQSREILVYRLNTRYGCTMYIVQFVYTSFQYDCLCKTNFIDKIPFPHTHTHIRVLSRK